MLARLSLILRRQQISEQLRRIQLMSHTLCCSSETSHLWTELQQRCPRPLRTRCALCSRCCSRMLTTAITHHRYSPVRSLMFDHSLLCFGRSRFGRFVFALPSPCAQSN